MRVSVDTQLSLVYLIGPRHKRQNSRRIVGRECRSLPFFYPRFFCTTPQTRGPVDSGVLTAYITVTPYELMRMSHSPSVNKVFPALPANQGTRRALLVNFRMVAKNEFFTAALIPPQMLREPLRSTPNVISDVAEASVVIDLCNGTIRHDSKTARRSTVATEEYRVERSPRDPMDNLREVAPFCAIRTASQHGCCPRSSKSKMLGSSAGIEEHHTIWMGSKPPQWAIIRQQNPVATSSSSQSWGLTLVSATNALQQAPSIDGSAAMQTSLELGQSLRPSMEGRTKPISHGEGHPIKKEWANMSHGCDLPFLQLDEDGSALMQTGQSLGHPMYYIDNKLATNGHPNPSMWDQELLHQSWFRPVLACFSRDLTPLQSTSASQLGSICLGTSVSITKRRRSSKSAGPSAFRFIYMHFQGQIRPELGIQAPSNGQKHGENTSQTPALARLHPHEKVWDPPSSCHAMQGRRDSIATHVTMKPCAIADAKMRDSTGQGQLPEDVGGQLLQDCKTRRLPPESSNHQWTGKRQCHNAQRQV